MNISIIKNDNLFNISKKELTKKVSFDEYKNKIIKDINNKLGINNDKSLKQKIFGEKYFLNEIKDVFTEKMFDDMLELTKNGLLKHHCCYIDCPQYLTKFDEKNSLKGYINSRFGLMNHFKYDMWNNTYIKSFHKTAKTLYKKNYEDFKKGMCNYYENDDKYRVAFLRYEHIEELLKATYNAYNKK